MSPGGADDRTSEAGWSAAGATGARDGSLARAVKRPVAVMLVAVQLAGCASTAKEEGFASHPEPERESSAAATIASAAGGGALVGLAMAGELISSCSGDGCGYVAGFALLLIPVAAVIGAGVGVVAAAIDHEDKKVTAKENAIRSGADCPDPGAVEWLQECRLAQGPMPPAFSPPADGSQAQPDPRFASWFDTCGASLERKLEARTRRLVPQVCRRDPVPTPDRVQCMQRSAAAEQQAELDRLLLAAQREKFERDATVGRCSF